MFPAAQATEQHRTQRVAWDVALIAGAIKLAAHLLVLAISPYGFQRDEFLYVAMARHLRLWHMDFPPLIAILGKIQLLLFGHTLAAARVFPAIEGTIILVLAILITAELGGGRFAQAMTAICVLSGGIFLRTALLFQPVVLDQLWWTLGLYALIRLGREPGKKWWLVFGVAVGFGLLTKFSILFFGFSVLVAMLLTPARRWLITPWPWLAAAICLAIGSPSIAGELALGVPVAGQMRDLQHSQLTHVTWWWFVAEQPFMVGPVPMLIAIAGAAALVLRREWRAVAVAGWTCIAAFVLLLLLHGKPYYIGPIYPTLLAAGSVMLERAWATRRAPRLALRAGAIAGTVAIVAVGLPVALPLFSPATTAVWAVRVGASEALRTNQGVIARLPQDYADMLGWEEQARAVANIVNGLTPAQRDSIALAAGNWGEAGALEFYGPRYGLPPVISTAGSFYYFGPGTRPGWILVDIGEDSATIARLYADVHTVAVVRHPWAIESPVNIVIGRRPRMTLQQLWPQEAGHQ